eukprot:505687-Pelagomonas_calceolata.AAC.1
MHAIKAYIEQLIFSFPMHVLKAYLVRHSELLAQIARGEWENKTHDTHQMLCARQSTCHAAPSGKGNGITKAIGKIRKNQLHRAWHFGASSANYDHPALYTAEDTVRAQCSIICAPA